MSLPAAGKRVPARLTGTLTHLLVRELALDQLQAVARENFPLRSDPVFLLETGDVSAFLVKLVRALTDFGLNIYR